jgi:hypothetical protein
VATLGRSIDSRFARTTGQNPAKARICRGKVKP